MEDLGVGPHCVVIDRDVRCICGRKLRRNSTTVRADRTSNRMYRYRYIECGKCGGRRRIGRTEVLQQPRTKH